MLKQAGFEQVGFRDRRHTYAGIQIDLDHPIKYIQEHMDWSRIKGTLDISGHFL
jgi:integrase